jgi:hypothetical protein
MTTCSIAQAEATIREALDAHDLKVDEGNPDRELAATINRLADEVYTTTTNEVTLDADTAELVATYPGADYLNPDGTLATIQEN